MKIGIVGAGKMGMDLFNWLIEYDHHVTLLCKNAAKAESVKAKTDKRLKRYFKSGLLSAEEYEKKQSMYCIGDRMELLESCTLVIEAITEEQLLKAKLFKEIEKIVSKECILATNTSSIPLREIFRECKDRGRCLGMHVFYPIGINLFAELNIMQETDGKFIRTAEMFLKEAGKEAIRLEEENNFLLTRLLTGIISQAYGIYQEGYLSPEGLEALIKKEVMLFGPFEIIDETGSKIIYEALNNFKASRYRGINAPLYAAARSMIEEGRKNLKQHEEARREDWRDEGCVDKYKEEVSLRIKAFIINEFAAAANETQIDIKVLDKAMTSILGLNKSPIALFQELTASGLRKGMQLNASKHKDDIWNLADYSSLMKAGGCMDEE